MSRVLNIFYQKIQLIEANPRLVLSEIFLMTIFSDLIAELPPFRDYWVHLYRQKKMNIVSRKSGARLMGLAKAREEFFHPTIPTNRECQARVIQLGQVFGTVVVNEFRDKRKAAYQNIDESNSEFCYKNCKDCIDKMLKGYKAVNDNSEWALGITTLHIQRANNILVPNAAGEASIKYNKVSKRVIPVHGKEKGDQSIGIFHQFTPELADCILRVAVDDAPEQRERNN